MLPKFDLIQPQTLAEALRWMNGEETVLPICGGTDVFVRLRAGVGLYIGIRGAEQSLGTLNRKVFHNVHAAAASVVPVCGVSLCILVGEDTAGGGKYCFRNDILRCDKFKSVLLARKLRPDGSGDFRIVRRQAPVGAADPFIHDHDTTSFQIFALFRLRQ